MATENGAPKTFLLNDLIGIKAVAGGRRVGKLAEVVATETEPFPEVTHLLITRRFGHPSLMVPWAKVGEIGRRSVTLAIEAPEPYEGEPKDGQVCLKDHLLDKKVLDCDDDEVEVVYDIKLSLRAGRLYATDVDCSRVAFLRRIGLRGLASFVRGLAARLRDDTIPWTYVQRLPKDMGSFSGAVKLNVLKAKLPEIHPVDLADILEELDHNERMAVFSQLETEQASDTLEEIEPRVQRALISALPVERAAELIDEMTPAQAADTLAALPERDVDGILALTDPDDREKIRRLIRHHDDKITDFATALFVAFPPEATIARVLAEYRDVSKESDLGMYIYVIDGERRLLGVIDLREVLESAPEERLADLMSTNLVTLHPADTVKDAAKLFARYSFRALPIVDDAGTIVGVIPYRDVVNLEHRMV